MSTLIVTGSVATGFLRKGWHPAPTQKHLLTNIPQQKIKDFILRNTSCREHSVYSEPILLYLFLFPFVSLLVKIYLLNSVVV
jgi:hypothetical protein